MVTTISIYNFKGGTGKSTSAVNLAALFARKSLKTALVDLDGQRNASFHLGLDGKTPTAVDWLLGEAVNPIPTPIENLFLIPGDIRLYQLEADEDIISPAFAKLSDFDFCIFDCPPGVTTASSQAILACDRVLIPIVCQDLSLKGLAEAILLIKEQKPAAIIDVLRTRHRKNLNEYRDNDAIVIESQEEFGYNLLNTIIPENTKVGLAVREQQPVIVCFPRSSGAKAYVALADEYLRLIDR